MDPFVVLGAGLASVAAVAAVLGVRAVAAAPREMVLDRARRVTRTSVAPEAPAAAGDGASVWAALLGPLSGLARPKKADEMSRIRKTLSYAGFRGDHATDVFFGSKIALGLLFGGGILLVNAARTTPIPSVRSLAVILVAVGFYAPNAWLQRRVRARQTAISHQLADTLDLLVTCVEAGLGLDAAIDRIAQQIGFSAPELAAELRLTGMEIQAGVVRADAFRRLAERTGVEELRSLSAMIIQTEMFGTSVAHALRVHASSLRTRRTHVAEEKGATASVRMMIPLVFCILPSLLAVILGPAVVRIITMLIPGLHGAQ